MIRSNHIYIENIDELVEELKKDTKDVECCVWNVRKKLIKNDNDVTLEYSADELVDAIGDAIWDLASLRDNLTRIKNEINTSE